MEEEKFYFIKYKSLSPYNREWLDNCGIKFINGNNLKKTVYLFGDCECIAIYLSSNGHYIFMTGTEKFFTKQSFFSLLDGNFFCIEVAKKIGIGYKFNGIDPNKKLTPEIDDLYKDCKYPNTREFLNDVLIGKADDYCEKLIEKVLKDLPQKYILCHEDMTCTFIDEDQFFDNPIGEIYQKIGSRKEKVEIVNEGFVNEWT